MFERAGGQTLMPSRSSQMPSECVLVAAVASGVGDAEACGRGASAYGWGAGA